ncbi:MAG: 4Fe-4S binding protein [Desulfarculaceae bacterium]
MQAKKQHSKRQRVRRALIFISFLLFPVTIFYFSPVLILEAAAQETINGSFLMFAALFLASLVLGRGFCGWACPGAGLGEACSLAWQAQAPGGRWNWIKYFLWAPWLGAIAVLAVSAGGYQKIDPWLGTWHGISVHDGPSYIVYFFFVALITILAWYPGKRGFCHYVCWMAPFMVMGTRLSQKGKWPALHLEVTGQPCAQCRTCGDNCPMSLDVPAMVVAGDMKNSECILCGTCVDNCPQGVIRYAWRPGKPQPSPLVRADGL